MNTYDPNDPGVIDQFTSAIYEMEAFNHFAHGYALSVLHHYFGPFSDEWYTEWISTEEFRGGKYPDGHYYDNAERFDPHSPTLKRYERMYDMYWDARGEWYNIMIANLNMANLRESNRMMFLHTLTTNQSWEEYGKAAQAAPRVNHTMYTFE